MVFYHQIIFLPKPTNPRLIVKRIEAKLPAFEPNVTALPFIRV